MAFNGEKSLWCWKYTNKTNSKHDPHSSFQNVHTIMQCLAASSNCNFRVGFSKMLYVGFVSILMKTMENFNGVHTWLMWKVFESLYISSFSALYCVCPSFEHTDTLSHVQESFIPFDCWLWTPKRNQASGDFADLIFSLSFGDWVCNSCFQPLLGLRMKMITLTV